MEEELGGSGAIEAAIAAGQESGLRDWLASRVYPLGRSVNAEELVEQVSGQKLGAAAFLRYLRSKLERLQTDP
jgi:carboxypeptidase Taq